MKRRNRFPRPGPFTRMRASTFGCLVKASLHPPTTKRKAFTNFGHEPLDAPSVMAYTSVMATNAEAKAAQRKRSVKLGLCRECLYRKAKKGRKTCAECLEAALDRYNRNKAPAPQQCDERAPNGDYPNGKPQSSTGRKRRA
jgi:hypothetical protein